MKRFIVCLTLIIMCGCASKPAKPIAQNNVDKRIKDNMLIGVEEYHKGKYQDSKGFLEEALNLAYSIDNIDEQINAMINLAELNMAFKNMSVASNYIYSAEYLYKATDSSKYAFQLYITLGKYKSIMSDTESSISYYYQALSNTTIDVQKAIVYNNLGIIYNKIGENQKALDFLFEAQKINEKHGITPQLAANYHNIAEVYREQGKWQESYEYYKKALMNDKRVENSVGIISDLQKLAIVSFQWQRDIDKALFYLSRAYKIAQVLNLEKHIEEISLQMNIYRIDWLKEKAYQSLEKKIYSETEDYLKQALEIAQSINNQEKLQEIKNLIKKTEIATGILEFTSTDETNMITNLTPSVETNLTTK